MPIPQTKNSARERRTTQRTAGLATLCIATACSTASIAPSIARADDTDGTFTPIRASDVPAELRPFVEAGTDAIAIERADLNGDGREDVLLVLQARRLRADADGFERRIRPLLILTRGEDGTLRLRKRNDKLAMCPECGGMMGDPLQSVAAKPKSFRVEHYGGSGWRWSLNYQFDYSRRDDTWQLVRIEKTSFHASEPEQAEKNVVLKPPKDYGKIDIADFDPELMRD